MRRILILARETDAFVMALRTPLICAGFDFIAESSLDSLSYQVTCNSFGVGCKLVHCGVEVNHLTHALLINRLSPYHNSALTLFRQSEEAAGIWAALSILPIPVLNRPSDIGIFPGSDPSYLAPKLRKIGWRFSKFFDATVGDLLRNIPDSQQLKNYELLENCFAFFLVGRKTVPIWNPRKNPLPQNSIDQLLNLLTDSQITFALVVIAMENEFPSLIEINPWPPVDFLQAFAKPVADSIQLQFG